MGAEQSAAAPGEEPVATEGVIDGVAVPVEAASTPPTSIAQPSSEQIEVLGPEETISKLSEATAADPALHLATIESCCKRVRVLCRDVEQCKQCDVAGAAAAVVGAMRALSSETSVQLQGLAAIVNLCSGEANEHRMRAVDTGALVVIVAAMTSLVENAEVQEMGCIALQNCCYGEDDLAISRRKEAAKAGAIRAVVEAMKAHSSIPAAQEVGVATLRLIVHKVPELRKQAEEDGAAPEWVKSVTKEGGGIMSFRKGFGTSRKLHKGKN